MIDLFWVIMTILVAWLLYCIYRLITLNYGPERFSRAPETVRLIIAELVLKTQSGDINWDLEKGKGSCNYSVFHIYVSTEYCNGWSNKYYIGIYDNEYKLLWSGYDSAVAPLARLLSNRGGDTRLETIYKQHLERSKRSLSS